MKEVKEELIIAKKSEVSEFKLSTYASMFTRPELLKRREKELKRRDKVVENWEYVVKLQKSFDKKQKYILSQLLENVQKEYENKEYIDDKMLKILIPLTCQVFVELSDDLPTTFPLIGPIGWYPVNNDIKIAETKRYRLKSGKFSYELCEDLLKSHVIGVDKVLVNVLALSIAEEIKETFLTGNIYCPYLLLVPSREDGLKQLYTRGLKVV